MIATADVPNPADLDFVRQLAGDWCAKRDWAEELLMTHLGLAKPEDVLRAPFRGTHQIPNTEYSYRTHGIGVDICKPVSRGGID
ncbi:MAG: hypothetical protein ACJAYU_003441 [Bradymonadia bacterium]|jgi:hypothetical protein